MSFRILYSLFVKYTKKVDRFFSIYRRGSEIFENLQKGSGIEEVENRWSIRHQVDPMSQQLLNINALACEIHGQ